MTSSTRKNTRPKILAIASGGGHWVQLLRLRPAFEGLDIAYATVGREYRDEVKPARFYRIPDATRWSKLGCVWLLACVSWVAFRERPDVVISTGAAPGYFAIRLGRLLGARTVWIDSIANVGCLSMSGEKIRPYADLWLTQWPHLARPGGPSYAGSIL